MATDPLRLRVLKAITASLNLITPANGYHFDLSSSVFRGRDYFGEDDPIPMVAILESPDEDGQNPAPEGSGLAAGPWRLFIQGWAEDDKENPTDEAHILMADVKKRLAIESKAGRSDYNAFGMQGVVDKILFTPGVVRPPDAISGKAYFWIVLHLHIVEDVSNPYSL